MHSYLEASRKLVRKIVDKSSTNDFGQSVLFLTQYKPQQSRE